MVRAARSPFCNAVEEDGYTMKGRKGCVFGGLVLALAAAVLVAASVGGAARAASPIVIGWAYDSKGQMSPFDGPALAAAQVRIKQINAKGGVDGRMLEIKTCDTQNNNPAKAKSCAAGLLGQGRDRCSS